MQVCFSKSQRVDLYFPELKRYYDAFINDSTVAIQVEDPGLGPLPLRLQTADHQKKKDFYNRYANKATGNFKTHLHLLLSLDV